MRLRHSILFILLATTTAAHSAIVTYTSPGPHRIHDGPAFMPFTLDVTGLLEPIAELTVTFTNILHEHPADIDALLVEPGGQNVMLISDVGELLSDVDSMIDQVTLTFRDGAAPLPANVRITSGTYAPTNYQGIVEEIPEMDQNSPQPPPLGPYGTTLSAFNGLNPNGTWKLFVQDDVDDDSGEMQSWSLTVTTVPEPISALFLLIGAGALCLRVPRITGVGPDSPAKGEVLSG